MYTKSFDGTLRANALFSRIAAEERVVESLTSDTILAYSRKIKQIANRASISNYSQLTPEIIVEYLKDRAQSKKITQATARMEKSSALFWLAEKAQGIIDSGSRGLENYESAYLEILAIAVGGLPKISTNTSSVKAKDFPDEAIELLMKAAYASRSEHLLNALMFIKANLHVGLRPIEWLDANLERYLHRDPLGDPICDADGSTKSSLSLVVFNHLDGEKIGHIQKWLKFIENVKSPELMLLSEVEIHKKIYGSMQRAIRRVLIQENWQGKIPAIYSTRHQAVANARADGLTQKEIAALFGHSSTNTARRHYGKKNAGYSGRSMRPAPESIWAVRSTVAVRPKLPRPEPSPGLG